MSTQRKIVIVGGVAGGATAAARARRTDEHAEIILLEKGAHISFANCGLPYYVGGEIGDRSALLLQTPESFRARFNVDVRVQHEVISINRQEQYVTVRNLVTEEVYTKSYTTLILAPGARPIKPKLPGIDKPNVFVLRNVPDADSIRQLLDSAQPRRAVVVGAGFIGLEMVEQLIHRGIDVTLVELAPQVLPPLDVEMAAFVSQAVEQMGAKLILGDGIAAFTGKDRADTAVLASERQIPGDIFLLGIGVQPDTDLAKKADLELGETGAIKVDAHCRTSDPHIYAAGDAVEVVHLVTGKPSRIPLAGPANKQGRVAGANAAGGNLTFPGALGTAIVRIGETVAGITGLSERAAVKAGFNVAVSYTVNGDHADYFPGMQEMVIKIVYEQPTGRLLGAQVIGAAGVDKRLDVFATALLGHLGVDDLANLDLAYAPPFGAAKDPAIVAGMVAQNARSGQVKLITPRDLAKLLDQVEHVQIVDVRPEYEAYLGGVPGAVGIYVDELRHRLVELNPAWPIVVYDQNGAKGYVAARILMQKGYTDVYSLSGGYTAWSAWEASQR